MRTSSAYAPAALCSVLCSVLCAALFVGACGGAEISPEAEARIVNEDSPYSFHRALARTMLKTKQPRRAMAHVRKLIKLRPELPEPYVLLARVYSGLGLEDAAIGALLKAVHREPKHLPAVSLLGVVHDRQGKHEIAEKWHRRALSLAPDSVSLHNNLGFSLFLQKRHSEALKVYQEAMQTDSGSARLLNNLGFLYADLGNDKLALKHFRAAGGEAAAANNLGLVFERRGTLEAAYDHFSMALEVNPDLDEARGNLARVSEALGREMPTLQDNRESLPPPSQVEDRVKPGSQAPEVYTVPGQGAAEAGAAAPALEKSQ